MAHAVRVRAQINKRLRMGGARACVWHASADQDVADDVKLQGGKSRRQIIYLRHSVCDGTLGRKKKRKEVTTDTFTLVRVHGSTVTDVAHLHYAASVQL